MVLFDTRLYKLFGSDTLSEFPVELALAAEEMCSMRHHCRVVISILHICLQY